MRAYAQTWRAERPVSRVHRHGAWRRPGGFTFVELMMGMVVTCLVMGALAAFTMAMGQSWNGAQSPQTVQLTGAVLSVRLADVLRNSLAIGVVWPGSMDSASAQTAGVTLWLGDDLTVDGKIQWGEIGWLEYDPVAKTLRLYQRLPVLNMIQSFAAKPTLTQAAWSDVGLPTQFKGKSFVTSQLLASNVAAAYFSYRNPNDINGRPSLEYVITLNQNGQQEVCYGNAALRVATTPQN